MKHFIQLSDAGNLHELIQQALKLKQEPLSNLPGKGKTLGMLFFNASLRTRLSTEKAARLLGMEVMSMNVMNDGWALEFSDGVVMNSDKAEHVKEAAGVLSQYCDVLAVRSFPGLIDKEADQKEQVLEAFRQYASIPVLNLESATAHPLQAIADAMTILELQKKQKPKVVLTWAPHPKALPQSVPNSFAQIMQQMEVDLVITNPVGYDLDPKIVGQTPVVHHQEEAMDGADFVYVKNWSSFEHYGKVLNQDQGWMMNQEKWQRTNEAKVMHCLPVRRNVVISQEVLDSSNSVVLQQAGNRTFAAQAVIKKLLEG